MKQFFVFMLVSMLIGALIGCGGGGGGGGNPAGPTSSGTTGTAPTVSSVLANLNSASNMKEADAALEKAFDLLGASVDSSTFDSLSREIAGRERIRLGDLLRSMQDSGFAIKVNVASSTISFSENDFIKALQHFSDRAYISTDKQLNTIGRMVFPNAVEDVAPVLTANLTLNSLQCYILADLLNSATLDAGRKPTGSIRSSFGWGAEAILEVLGGIGLMAVAIPAGTFAAGVLAGPVTVTFFAAGAVWVANGVLTAATGVFSNNGEKPTPSQDTITRSERTINVPSDTALNSSKLAQLIIDSEPKVTVEQANNREKFSSTPYTPKNSGDIPSQVTGVQASQGTLPGKVLVFWKGVDSVSYYTVTRTPSGGNPVKYPPLLETPATSYEDYPNDSGKYDYYIHAFNDKKNRGPVSEKAAGYAGKEETTTSPTTPTMPTTPTTTPTSTPTTPASGNYVGYYTGVFATEGYDNKGTMTMQVNSNNSVKGGFKFSESDVSLSGNFTATLVGTQLSKGKLTGTITSSLGSYSFSGGIDGAFVDNSAEGSWSGGNSQISLFGDWGALRK